MPLFDRLSRALNAAHRAWTAQHPVDAAPAPPVPLPAAFRSRAPSAHPTMLHFYTASDFSNDPKGPLNWVMGRSEASLRSMASFVEAGYALPDHVRLHWDWVANKDDGCYTHMRKRVKHAQHMFSYDIAWVKSEPVLVVYHVAEDTSVDNSVYHRRRTYVTRLSLPHPLFKHLHTIHLPAPLASRLDSGMAVG